jgi:ketosteroid isomerase-like protein
MSGDDAHDAVGLFYEAFDRGNIEEALSNFSTELEIVDPGMGTVHGQDRFREYLETLKRALPDAQAVIEYRADASDTVVVEGRFVGTHTGPLAR